MNHNKKTGETDYIFPYEITGVYNYAPAPDASQEEVIEAKKNSSRIEKDIRKKIKSNECKICGASCSSFCNSHSIPRFILDNISEQGFVSALNQAESWEPDKRTGIAAAGVFSNICNNCDNTVFQQYEDETAFSLLPQSEILTQIALKNYLKWIYRSMVDVEQEKAFEKYITDLKLVKRGEVSPANHDLREMIQELEYTLKALDGQDKYYLQYYKKLDYVVPYAAQYLMAMLQDLTGNLIHDIYNPSPDYRLEYLHVAIFPLLQSSVIIIFTKEGEQRHRRFIRQLKKLDAMDQLSAINYLTLSGTDNVFFNPSTYDGIVAHPVFTAVRRMTYSIKSTVPNPQSLRAALQTHSFEKRYALPNLLSPEYALRKEIK